MGSTIYTAAMLWCLIGQPQSFVTCEVMNSKQKFMTEEQCWATLNAQMAKLITETDVGKLYEPVDAQCFSWLNGESKL